MRSCAPLRHPLPSWLGFVLLGALAALFAAAPARAQTAPQPTGALSGLPVQVTLTNFGVADIARAGDWAGFRFTLQDNSGQPTRRVLVQLHGFDQDGDTPLMTRELTLNQGVQQQVWIYARLPFSFRDGDALEVTVNDADEGGVKPTGEAWYKAGKLVGRGRYTTFGNKLIRATQGMIAVVGANHAGLHAYSDTMQVSLISDTVHPRGHEVTNIGTGLVPDQLPDRWIGYAAFDALVWVDGDPALLRGERATAVRDYVRHGGHLIIVMPEVGQSWTNAKSNDLLDIMPAAAVQRNENVDPAPYRPLLNVRRSRPYPKKAFTVHTFRVLPDAGPNDAIPILNGPDGRCVVVRRLVGAGCVTFVGLPVNETAFTQFSALDPDVFWNRVLGRRGKVEADQLGEEAKLQSSLSTPPRNVKVLDLDIARAITQSGRTAIGVLAGFLVFVAYWIVAGPVGYSVLKAKGLQRHAWIGFVLSTAAFTALAWGGATLLRPQTLAGRHMTVLDHVYGQNVQRARMWANLFLPGYGQRTVEVPAGPDGMPNMLAAWDAPRNEDPAAGFTDTRGYLVDGASPGAASVPTRATSKSIQVDWAGALKVDLAGGTEWGMPLPTGQDGTGPGTLTLHAKAKLGGTEPLVTGTLVHSLPGILHDVTIIVVTQQSQLRPVTGRVDAVDGRLLAVAHAYATASWKPGAENALDLGLVTLNHGGDTLAPAFLDGLSPPAVNNYQSLGAGIEYGEELTRLNAMSFYSVLRPPDTVSNDRTESCVLRYATHGMDLGRWFTQPCVIVVGYLGGKDLYPDVPSPVPLKVDGKDLTTSGRVVVRWVYPFPPQPPEFPDSSTQDAPATPPPPSPSPSTPPPDGTGK